MVKIAISGGSGEIAHEIIDHLVATGKHEIFILSRKEPTTHDAVQPGTSWIKVDYDDKKSLVDALKGVHTVLCFITAHLDPEAKAQKNLIDAAVEAGVKRFAPSEWSVSDPSALPWYASKTIVREYLAELNKNKKVLEYTLFQPGLLLDYLANPHKTSPHLTQLELNVDIKNRRILVVDPDTLSGDENDATVYTSLHDIATVVTAAVSFEGEWPRLGGIRGSCLTSTELISLAEEITGEKFKVERLNMEDLKRGEIKSSWYPKAGHPSIPADQIEAMSKILVAGVLIGQIKGAFRVGNEWNRLLPEVKFQGVEEFLKNVWQGKNGEIRN